MLHPLSREDGSVVYNCCWPSPAQPFSGSRPARFTTKIDCLRFETRPTWRTRSLSLYPPGTGWLGYTPRQWVLNSCSNRPADIISARTGSKTPFIVVLQSFPWEHVWLRRRYSITAAYTCLLRIC
jgi:hypothetical protein